MRRRGAARAVDDRLPVRRGGRRRRRDASAFRDGARRTSSTTRSRRRSRRRCADANDPTLADDPPRVRPQASPPTTSTRSTAKRRRGRQGRQRRSPPRVSWEKRAAAGRQREPAARVRRLGVDARPREPRRGWPTALARATGPRRFASPTCFAQALTHRSYGAPHNERLEFVGDAVLNCVVARRALRALSRRCPKATCRACARASSTATRWRASRAALGLGDAIALGEGEQRSGGADRPSILADALEAVFGAVFVDGGFDAARAVDRSHATATCSRDADPATLGKDPKTRLQEWLQARRLAGAGVRGRRDRAARRTRRRSPSNAGFRRSASSTQRDAAPAGARPSRTRRPRRTRASQRAAGAARGDD